MNSPITIPSIFPVTCHTDFVGHGSCFVAIEGYADNGVKYIRQAIEKGARTIVVHHNTFLDDELCSFIHMHGVVVERVDNTRKALAELSTQAAGFPAKKLRIIGITGTKGKTTTSFLLEHILHSAGYKTALISSAQNRICGHNFSAPLTTPQPDYLQQFLKLCVEHNVDYVVMEVAAQALTLHRVAGITFCGIIFTNFSHEHLEFYPTLDDYFYAKTLIFDMAAHDAPILVNGDDAHGIQLLDQHMHAVGYGFGNISKITVSSEILYSSARPELVEGYPRALEETLQQVQGEREKTKTLSGNSRDVCYKGIHISDPIHGIMFEVQYRNDAMTVVCPKLFGAYNGYNVLAATSMALALSITPDTVHAALLSFSGVPGRLQEHVLTNGARCFIDYAHNPESFEAVLSTLRSLTHQLIVLFGAGGGRDKSKRPMMGAIAAQIADIVVITSDNPRLEDPIVIADDIIQGIPVSLKHKVVQELDRKKAIEHAYFLSDQGSIIALLGKGPDEYQIIGTTKHYFSEQRVVEQL